MMHSVLANVHELMRDDGSMWLHLDANELAHGRLLGDEVFGSTNFVGIVTWEKTKRPAFLHGQMSSITDYLVVFAKDRAQLKPFTHGMTDSGKRTPLAHRGNPVVELSFPPGVVKFNCPDGTYDSGDHSSATISARVLEKVVVKDGRNLTRLRMSLPSRYSAAKLEKLIEEDAAFLVPRVPFRPSYIAVGGKPKLISNLWSWQLESMETNEDAARQQDLLFPGRPFRTAKPEGLLRRIIELATDPGDTVLDCFAGSGTTPAVAEELGRRWIAVEKDEWTANHYLKVRMAGRGPTL
ncbi:site-specific DNA-methyltransferase [Arthrobacter sp. NQ7]|uniref:DNA methyltransferase n=1 Tax=Arthrobacter sp. NQ7 TaxID=3032303 RepID=UPI0024101F60|nr:site-specific DNA-methyltransferase [Arthrobacter sp. NQ7]MDJ0459906.1 site-specific DNA-methyltransferase [Arthrobacter sp. NQ7]